MKFLVLGCNGMAGHIISLYLTECGHEVLGFGKTKSMLVRSIAGDAKNLCELGKIIIDGQFDAVINCIGILNHDAENNKESAVFLNAYLPHYLAEITRYTKTQVIHMSTDCVFSGKKGAYTEDDLRDGETFYDRTKAMGELEDEKNITLRNSIVGPDINPDGIGLLNWFLKKTAGREPVDLNGFTTAIWSGQTTLQLAKTMELAARERVHGLYHAVPDHSISKYELLVLFDQYFRAGKDRIHAVEGIGADKSLRRTRYDFAYQIPDYETMIRELAVWMTAHKQLYPAYRL